MRKLEEVMRFSPKKVGWCAAVAVTLALAASRPCWAQAAGEAKEAAQKAAVEAIETEEGDGGPNPLRIDPDLAIWTLVVFVALFLFLAKFAWPQIDLKLATAAGEVRALLDEARRDAEHTKTSIVAEARKAAEGERDRALVEIHRAKEGAIHDLAERTANIAIDLAKQVTRKELTTDRNNELVREALEKLKPSTN
jgi:F-type H+-transporting ATPase subunit b